MSPKTPASVAVQMSMLENGLDFIRSGLKSIASPQSKFDLKYAVLHLSAGIELVLKDRLRREDWQLIFVDPAKATEQKFKSGNFKSVDLDECLKRLEENCTVALTEKAALRSFKSLRNPIEHFQTDINRDALEASSAKVLGPLLDFVSEAFDVEDLSEEESDLLQEIRTLLVDFTKFTSARLKTIQPLLKNHGQIVECPSCLQDTLMADFKVHCAFCGYNAMAEDAAAFYISNSYGNIHDPEEDYPEIQHWCPNCDNHALVYDQGYRVTNGVCFACGDTPAPGDYVACEQCQELFDPDRIFAGRCAKCFGPD
jgi:hypothetical protein